MRPLWGNSTDLQRRSAPLLPTWLAISRKSAPAGDIEAPLRLNLDVMLGNSPPLIVMDELDVSAIERG